MTGPALIEWAVSLCQQAMIPPTDNAIVRMIRQWVTEIPKEMPRQPGARKGEGR